MTGSLHSAYIPLPGGPLKSTAKSYRTNAVNYSGDGAKQNCSIEHQVLFTYVVQIVLQVFVDRICTGRTDLPQSSDPGLDHRAPSL